VKSPEEASKTPENASPGDASAIVVALRAVEPIPISARADCAADHNAVLTLALAQLPEQVPSRVLVRTDSGGGTKAHLAHLTALGLHYSVGIGVNIDVDRALETAKLTSSPSPPTLASPQRTTSPNGACGRSKPSRRSPAASPPPPPAPPAGLPHHRRQTEHRHARRPRQSHRRRPLATHRTHPRLTHHLNAYAGSAVGSSAAAAGEGAPAAGSTLLGEATDPTGEELWPQPNSTALLAQRATWLRTQTTGKMQ
jgi:hypothetical protein